jgi:hypothetical protein
MPENLADHLQIGAARQHQGRCGVAEVVEADAGEAAALCPRKPPPSSLQYRRVRVSTLHRPCVDTLNAIRKSIENSFCTNTVSGSTAGEWSYFSR